MPAAVAAGIASTALTAPVIAGGLGALGTGLAAGASLAGSGGLLGSLGLSPIGTGLGGLAPGVAANIAPAAASQLAGTVAPSLVQASLPGLQGGMGTVLVMGVERLGRSRKLLERAVARALRFLISLSFSSRSRSA